jgi:hypothetical protein
MSIALSLARPPISKIQHPRRFACRQSHISIRLLPLACSFASLLSIHAADLDAIGVTLLRQFDPSLRGNGVRVALVESPLDGSIPPPFENDPASVSQPASLFTFYSSSGTTTGVYPNTAGSDSWHADVVGANFYSPTNGPAPNVTHVDNYEAEFFFNSVVAPGASMPARVANQSFIFQASFEDLVNTNYDNYIAQHRTIFVSGIFGENAMPPLCAPATSYNGIGVGFYNGFFIPGPTSDGRCKPDIVSPEVLHFPNSAVSYCTPYVSGSVAVLVQAGGRGDGGSNTNGARDVMTVKALLLNGALKPNGWTNGPTTPLDARYGAGVVNVFNSWSQLKGGQHGPIETTSVGTGTAHPPGPSGANESSLVGWDTNLISTASAAQDKIHHYYFNLSGSALRTLTATLVWNRQRFKSSINDLNLFLYDTSNSNLVASSVSPVDNVEHLSLPQLAPGRYDLQVLKKGSGQVSNDEAYALAFEIFSLNLSASTVGTNFNVSWPAAPTGFRLMSASSITPPVSWTPVGDPISVDTNASRNIVSLPIGASDQYFRLQRP